MADDLVKRLRAVGGVRHDGATRWYVNPDGPEAADRIEQLEAALREYRNDLCEYPFGDLCGKLNEEVCQGCAAAAALGENQT